MALLCQYLERRFWSHLLLLSLPGQIIITDRSNDSVRFVRCCLISLKDHQSRFGCLDAMVISLKQMLPLLLQTRKICYFRTQHSCAVPENDKNAKVYLLFFCYRFLRESPGMSSIARHRNPSGSGRWRPWSPRTRSTGKTPRDQARNHRGRQKIFSTHPTAQNGHSRRQTHTRSGSTGQEEKIRNLRQKRLLFSYFVVPQVGLLAGLDCTLTKLIASSLHFRFL